MGKTKKAPADAAPALTVSYLKPLKNQTESRMGISKPHTNIFLYIRSDPVIRALLRLSSTIFAWKSFSTT